MDPSPPVVPAPDATLEPAGFVVDVDGVRIHFLDWGGPTEPSGPGVLAIHGIGHTAWAWTPIARRLGGGRCDAHPYGVDAGLRVCDAKAEVHGRPEHGQEQQSADQRSERDLAAARLEPGQAGDQQRAVHVVNPASDLRP